MVHRAQPARAAASRRRRAVALRPRPPRLRRLAVSGLLALGACGGGPTGAVAPPGPAVADAPATARATSTWQVVDLMPAYWRFIEATRGGDPASRRAAFRQHLVEAHPEAFTEGVISLDHSAPFDLDTRIDAFLPEAAALEPAMRRLSAQVAEDLPRHRASFEAAFPDFTWSGRVYFTVSLLAFDGAVREVDGQPALFFGLDKVAKIHGVEASLAPLFHHELFHVYHLVHGKPFEGSPENLMYQALWAEGLAVHVARTLNPGATNLQLVLSDEMVRRGDAVLPDLARELAANLDSSDPIFYRDFFRGAGQRADVPTRVGYYLGLRVAEVLGRGKTLRELAALRDPALRAEIGRALDELARTPHSALTKSQMAP